MSGPDYLAAVGKRQKRRRPGRPPGPRPSRTELTTLYVQRGLSITQVAQKLNYKRDVIRRALIAYGIARRTCAKRSRLRAFRLGVIEDLCQGGMKHAADNLGVSLRTLQYYRAGLRKKTTARKRKTRGKIGQKKGKGEK